MLAALARVAALRRTGCVCGPGGRRQLWTGPPQSGTSEARSGRRSEPRPSLQPSAAPGVKCPSFPETPAHPAARPSAFPPPRAQARGLGAGFVPLHGRPRISLPGVRAQGWELAAAGPPPSSVLVGGSLASGLPLLSPPPPLNNFKKVPTYFRRGCRVHL